MDWQSVAEKVIFALGGGFVSLCVSHFMVSRDLAFLKGQLSQVMAYLQGVQKLKDKVTVLDTSLTKVTTDLNHAFEKLRTKEKGEANGPYSRRT